MAMRLTVMIFYLNLTVTCDHTSSALAEHVKG